MITNREYYIAVTPLAMWGYAYSDDEMIVFANKVAKELGFGDNYFNHSNAVIMSSVPDTEHEPGITRVRNLNKSNSDEPYNSTNS